MLAEEIKQNRPFRSLEQVAFLNVQKTADALLRDVAELLKPTGLSGTQYNVLRILRGVGPESLGCQEIASRMITRDPDMTRLLDRLEKRGCVARTRQSTDRRVVRTTITPAGLALLEQLDEPIYRAHLAQLGHMGHDRLATLIELLEEARRGGATKNSTTKETSHDSHHPQ
jgi:DNA-binding MarR family transcriptional regulator